MPTMRAKLVVANVEKADTYERLTFHAVAKADGYPEDGSDEDNSFARWTPSADMQMSITNPALFGQFEIGQKYYADFTKAE